MHIQGPPQRAGFNQCLEWGSERAHLTLPLWASGQPIQSSEALRFCPLLGTVELKGTLEKGQAGGGGDEFTSGCIKSKVPVRVYGAGGVWG